MDHLDENISSSSSCRGRGLDGMGMRGGEISLIRRKRKKEDFREFVSVYPDFLSREDRKGENSNRREEFAQFKANCSEFKCFLKSFSHKDFLKA